MGQTETAILAGGCFWGMQDLIRKLPGIVSTRVGYSGGDVQHATYRNHGTHAEAIEVVYDPQRLPYRKLLEFFFQIHDPTTKNRQGNDMGTSYRSGIYYLTDEQLDVAEDTIADVDASKLWPGPVVTEVKKAGPFWEAKLTGLQAATTYHYSIGNSPDQTFHTPPARGSSGLRSDGGSGVSHNSAFRVPSCEAAMNGCRPVTSS